MSCLLGWFKTNQSVVLLVNSLIYFCPQLFRWTSLPLVEPTTPAVLMLYCGHYGANRSRAGAEETVPLLLPFFFTSFLSSTRFRNRQVCQEDYKPSMIDVIFYIHTYFFVQYLFSACLSWKQDLLTSSHLSQQTAEKVNGNYWMYMSRH